MDHSSAVDHKGVSRPNPWPSPSSVKVKLAKHAESVCACVLTVGTWRIVSMCL